MVVAATVGIALMGGCQRVALDCDYTIVPKVQMYQGGVGNTPSDWSAYAYYGTKEDFYIGSSFDSIAMGQLWNHKKGEYVLCNAHEMQRGGGNIVFVNSNTAYRAIPNRIAYVSSKGGQLGLMRALALDLGKYNIRVNAVLPGMIKTDRWEKNPDFYKSVPSRFTPIGDVALGSDVADAVWYFAAHARNTTGAELVVDGGNTIQLYPIIK